MKRYLLILVSAFSFVACSDKKDTKPATAMDTGRTFIRASLDGDFKTAETLLLNDPANLQLFQSYKDSYAKIPDDKKRGYKEASYEINKIEELNDSTTIINYSNSYMHKPTEIKLVRLNNSWAVDFKYTISGNLPIN